MKLIFFHDFGSSSQCGVIKKLRGLLPDFEIVAPDIPIDPIGGIRKRMLSKSLVR